MNFAYCCRYEGRAVEIACWGWVRVQPSASLGISGRPILIALISLQDGICGGAAAPRSLTDFCRRAALAR
jgi:hypothetical protein